MTSPERARLGEVARVFVKLGCTSFGGPAAHIALMQRELVEARGWLSREEYLDLVGATNLVPGPNSTEVAIHLGLKRAGWPGFWAAGLGFIFPAFCAVLGLAWAYARGQQFPLVRAAFGGAMPVVVALVAQAAFTLGRSALKHRLAWALAGVALLLSLLRINEIGIVLGAALLGLLLAWRAPSQPRKPPAPRAAKSKLRLPGLMLLAPAGVKVAPLLWTFLKIGSVIYGSGYVLIAFLRADFVTRLHWITEAQLLDAVAIGQMTPGPLFTSATFIGFQVAGVGGAIAATVGIFAPSFAFVALLHALLDRLHGSPRARLFLDCVNAASWALMAFVAWQMARDVVLLPSLKGQLLPLLVFAAAFGLLLKKAPALVLIVGGAVLGMVARH